MNPEDWEDIEENVKLEEEDFSLDYKILMLGTSGVGKTVLMTSMLRDFLMAKSGLNIETRPELRNEILTNYDTLCRDSQLPASARHTEWNFIVKYDDFKLFNFSWIDYRGGSLEPENALNRANPMDFERIYDFLKEANAVLILADAQEFLQHPAKVRRELSAFRSYVESSLKRCPRGLHLVLALTKIDTVALKRGLLFTRWNEGEILETCNEAFQSVFQDLARNNDSVLCDVIPISSFGKSGVLTENGIVIKQPCKKLKSFQADVPLKKIFSSILMDLSSRIPMMSDEAENLLDDNSARLDAAKERYYRNLKNVLNFVTSDGRLKIAKSRSMKEYYERQTRSLERLLAQLRKKARIAANLVNEIEGSPMLGLYYE